MVGITCTLTTVFSCGNLLRVVDPPCDLANCVGPKKTDVTFNLRGLITSVTQFDETGPLSSNSALHDNINIFHLQMIVVRKYSITAMVKQKRESRKTQTSGWNENGQST